MESDQSRINPIGETKSGMFRFFVSAIDNFRLDEYGYADLDANRHYFSTIRDGLRGDPRALSEHKRKFPWKWEEAFATDSAKCIYDPILIEDAEARLDLLGDKAFSRGELRLIDETDWSKGVEYYDKSNGHHVHCLDGDFNEDEFNPIRQVGTNLFPMDPFAGMGGADPFDHNIVKNGEGSQGGGAMYRFGRPGEDEDDVFYDNFIWHYLGRPSSSRMYYKEMAKMCLFLGYRILVEDNKPKLIEYFEEKGMAAYLYTMRGQKKPGISASPRSHVMLMESTERHIIGPNPNVRKGGAQKSMLPEMIEDWKLFNPQKTTEHDLAMCSGWALVGADDLRFRKHLMEEERPKSTKWIRKRKFKKGKSRMSR